MYEKCGEQYRRRYIEKQIIPPGISMARGTGVHGGAHENFAQKVKSHEDLSRSKIVDAAVEKFKREIRNGIMLTPDEESIGHEKVVATATDSVAGLAGVLADEVVGQYQPIFVEERQRIIIPDSTHDLVARMDLADDQELVVDLKTSGKAKTQRDVDTAEQLTFYALVYKALTGKLPKGVRFEVLIETPKLKKRSRQIVKETGLPLTSTRDNAALQTLVHRINAMMRGLEAGVFIPALADSWQCSPRWCGYAQTCPYFHGR